MHRNSCWLLFLGLIILSSLGYTGYALTQLYHYWHLETSLFPNQVKWQVVKLDEETFAPAASYQYTFHDKTYTGRTIWHDHYLNGWTAQEAVKQLSQQPIPVWIDASAPENSQLEKIFPLKSSLYMIALWLLTLYFIWLGRYVTRYTA